MLDRSGNFTKADSGNSIVGCTGLWYLSFAKSDVKDEKWLSDGAEEIDNDANSLLSLLSWSWVDSTVLVTRLTSSSESDGADGEIKEL